MRKFYVVEYEYTVKYKLALKIVQQSLRTVGIELPIRL